MATPEQVITTDRLREAVGEIGNESDTLLSGYRSSVIGLLEKKFRRCIIDRDNFTTPPQAFISFENIDVPDMIGFSVSDVKAGSLTINYTNADDDPRGQNNQTLVIPTTDARVHIDRDQVLIYSMDGDDWSSVMRYSHPIPTLTCNRGMASGEIPRAWGDACALYVRALYDGSAYDDLGNMTALSKLIAPWVVSDGMRSAET